MSLNFSAAHSSRIRKRPQASIPLLKRSASSPFAGFSQRKPIKRSLTKPEVTHEDEDEDDFFGDRLEEAGLVKSLATDLSLRDIAQIILYIRSHMFEAIPESGGFNSTRIADILNFRKSLPSIVTIAHVHAMTESPTKTEREIAELTKAGIIRRIVIPGRGTGGSSVGDGLVLLKDIGTLVSQVGGLDPSTAAKFLEYLKANPMHQTFARNSFVLSDKKALMQAGFLTSSSYKSRSGDIYAPIASLSPGTATSIASISRAASGSMAAVGGETAIYDAGGRGGIRRSSSQSVSPYRQEPGVESEQLLNNEASLQLSLPNTGAYLKLVIAARSHLISLITKSRFRELPLYLLRERWDGGVSGDDPAARAKSYRGEFAGVLPSRTRKWRHFHGLSFDWVVAECLGGGLVEVFETNSVGRAIRITQT